MKLCLKWELSNAGQSEAQAQADVEGRHNRDKFTAEIFILGGSKSSRDKIKIFISSLLFYIRLLNPAWKDTQNNYVCHGKNTREDNCPLLRLISLIPLCLIPPPALLGVWGRSCFSNYTTLLGIFETEDSSEIEMMLFIPDLCPKCVSVQNPLSIPWVLFPTSDPTVLYPLETKQLNHVLLQLSPLRCMMSLCSAKHWEMFYFWKRVKNETKQKIFKKFTRDPLGL